MPLKFIYKRKRENWGSEADRELKHHKAVEKATATETRKRERAEASNWRREIEKEKHTVKRLQLQKRRKESELSF